MVKRTIVSSYPPDHPIFKTGPIVYTPMSFPGPPPSVSRADDGRTFALDADGFAALLIDGAWVSGLRVSVG